MFLLLDLCEYLLTLALKMVKFTGCRTQHVILLEGFLRRQNRILDLPRLPHERLLTFDQRSAVPFHNTVDVNLRSIVLP